MENGSELIEMVLVIVFCNKIVAIIWNMLTFFFLRQTVNSDSLRSESELSTSRLSISTNTWLNALLAICSISTKNLCLLLYMSYFCLTFQRIAATNSRARKHLGGGM